MICLEKLRLVAKNFFLIAIFFNFLIFVSSHGKEQTYVIVSWISSKIMWL